MEALVNSEMAYWKKCTETMTNTRHVDQIISSGFQTVIKQLLDEVEHDIMNYQSRGLCYLPKPKAEADNTDTRVW